MDGSTINILIDKLDLKLIKEAINSDLGYYGVVK